MSGAEVYLASSVINAITSLGIAAFVYFKNKSKPLNLSFVLFALIVAFGSMAYAFWMRQMIEGDYQGAFFWARMVLAFGTVLLPPGFVYFAACLMGDVRKYKGYFLASAVVILSTFSFLFSPYFISDLTQKLDFQYWPVPGPAYPLLVIWIMVSGLMVLADILRFLSKATHDVTWKRTRMILFATVIAFMGGITNVFLFYNIPIPPVGNFFVPLYVAMVAYCIVRYKFFDIAFVIKKVLVLAGFFGMAMVLVAGVSAASRNFQGPPLIPAMIAVGLAVLLYDPMRRFLLRTTDRYLFQRRFDYQVLLKDASRGMSKIESLRHLLGLVVHFITMKMRVRNAGILIQTQESDSYELGFQRGYKKNYYEYHLDAANPLISYLSREKEAIDLDRVQEFIDAGNIKKGKGQKSREYDFPAIKAVFDQLNVECAVPSFLAHHLQGVLLLGQKKSGDSYTADDLHVLFTLAQESAIAIENARLYDEAIAKSAQLEKINDQLAYSKALLIKSLKETELADKQLQDAQVQLIHEQKMATLGRLAASVGHEVNNPLTILSMNVSRAILKHRKNPDMRVTEILELFQKMEQNIARIKAVVNTLTGLLKKSEKGKFEPLSLKLVLEETLPLVQFQTYLDNLTGTEVEFDIPTSLPLIRGDLERLQEVFLNLFINAYHAMTGKGNRRIRAWAEMDAENPKHVAVHFTDNGCGMTEEIVKKIFNYGFTTKPPGKGSGMGLYMCKYIIELHGGTIRVASKIGEGTTFTITLPAVEEGAGEADHFRVEA